MPTLERGGSVAVPAGGVAGTTGEGRATGGCETGDDMGGGAGWMVVRGGCQGGIGDEQAGSPIASINAATTAARRPWPTSSTTVARQTARSMRFLPGFQCCARNRRA